MGPPQNSEAATASPEHCIVRNYFLIAYITNNHVTTCQLRTRYEVWPTQSTFGCFSPIKMSSTELYLDYLPQVHAYK